MKGARQLQTTTVRMKSSTSIFRSFDEEKAKQFYCEFLGFHLDWEHRFEEGMPLYMQLSHGDFLLHLSEHHGDCCPGATIRIEVDSLTTYYTSLQSKKFNYMNPAIETTPWGTLEMCVIDPFGNKLIFFQDN